MKDCRECRHALRQNFGTWLCCADPIPKPTSFMRDHRSECGRYGGLWEPKQPKEQEQAGND